MSSSQEKEDHDCQRNNFLLHLTSILCVVACFNILFSNTLFLDK